MRDAKRVGSPDSEVIAGRLREAWGGRTNDRPHVITELHLSVPGPVDPEVHPERTPVGPFPSREAADEWAATEAAKFGGDASWSVAPLRSPEETS